MIKKFKKALCGLLESVFAPKFTSNVKVVFKTTTEVFVISDDGDFGYLENEESEPITDVEIGEEIECVRTFCYNMMSLHVGIGDIVAVLRYKNGHCWIAEVSDKDGTQYDEMAFVYGAPDSAKEGESYFVSSGVYFKVLCFIPAKEC